MLVGLGGTQSEDSPSERPTSLVSIGPTPEGMSAETSTTNPAQVATLEAGGECQDAPPETEQDGAEHKPEQEEVQTESTKDRTKADPQLDGGVQGGDDLVGLYVR